MSIRTSKGVRHSTPRRRQLYDSSTRISKPVEKFYGFDIIGGGMQVWKQSRMIKQFLQLILIQIFDNKFR